MVKEIRLHLLEAAVKMYRDWQTKENRGAADYYYKYDVWIAAFDAACDVDDDVISVAGFCETIMDYNADATADLIADAITSLLGIPVK